MKVRETIERDCCQFGDFKSYFGLTASCNEKSKMVFCKHCGQIRILGKEAREPSFSDTPDILFVPVEKV